MKLCKDCRYYHEGAGEGCISYFSVTCLRPEVSDEVTGYMIDGSPDRAKECWIARQAWRNPWMPWRLRDDSCGPRGRYWEEK